MDWTLSHQKIQIKTTIRFQFILDRLAVIRKMNPYLVLVKMLNSSRTMEMRMIFLKKNISCVLVGFFHACISV